MIITLTALIMDISNAFNGSVHDFKIFKKQTINRALKKLLKLMKQIIVYGDSAYEALEKIFPKWICQINEKGKRNHPLSDEQKLKNRIKTKVRILVEHVISRIKKYRCCLERVRNTTATKQSRYWNIVAGLCNLRRAEELQILHVFGYAY